MLDGYALIVETFDWEHPKTVFDLNGQRVQVASVSDVKILDVNSEKRYLLEDALTMNQRKAAVDGKVGYRVVRLDEALQLIKK